MKYPLEQIELTIIKCIQSNIEESGDDVPEITKSTSVLSGGIPGFDSLRAIEVLIDLEVEFDCELPPEDVFKNGTENITDLAKAVQVIVEQE